jgi:membrane-bound lytic murein transglycosylase A
MMDYLQPARFSDLPGWQDDDHLKAFYAFLQSARAQLEIKPYRQKSLPVDADGFNHVCRMAIELSIQKNLTKEPAKEFFEQYFSPFLVNENGFVTGYYEPEIDVRFEKDEIFKYPFYRRPDDLIEIDDPDNPPDGIEPGYMFAQQTKEGVKPYPDRKEIDQGYLSGKNLEIAYAKNKADVYFTHIQGSARLKGLNGQIKRITYAAKAGHPYTSIGKILIERGNISQENMSMDAIRQWVEDNPSSIDELLWQNRSYIFFSEISDFDPLMGPIGAAKIQLMDQRSLAIDKNIYQFGLPIFVNVNDAPINPLKKHFQRLMIAHDTGSAILGSARGDIFIGTGLKAGEIAGGITHQATFFVLLPNENN